MINFINCDGFNLNEMLRDSFGRTFPYIRLSITDVCNFKCGYCLPNGYQIDK